MPESVSQSGPGATATPTATTITTPPPTGTQSVATPPAKSAEVVALEAKLAEAQLRADLMLRRQKSALVAEQKKEREGLSSKMARLEAMEKADAQAKLNKTAFLKAKFGDDWYDQIVAEKINGGAPTGDVVASEIAKLEEKFEARLKARDEEAAKATEAGRTQTLENSRRQLASAAAEMWSKAGGEFPLVESRGTPEQIAGEIARRVEAHYLGTTKRDEEGRVVLDGQILPLQKVAELWEAELVKLAEIATGHQKYASKFAPKSAVVAPTSAAPKSVEPRRTLSNDLTGRSTPATRQPTNDLERRERAIAAFEAIRKPVS